jgi:hypothetical protein
MYKRMSHRVTMKRGILAQTILHGRIQSFLKYQGPSDDDQMVRA